MKKLLFLLIIFLPTVSNADGIWRNWVKNSDCESDDASCFVCRDGNGNGDVNRITDGVGVNGSRGVKVHSIAGAANEWTTEFFVYTPDHVWNTGDHYRFRMSVRADKPSRINVQAHRTPGDYITDGMLDGSYNVTTEWQEIVYEGEVTQSQAGESSGGGGGWDEENVTCTLQTIAFNLNYQKNTVNNFYFDNISWESYSDEVDDVADQTFAFVDEQGNVVPDGSTITINVLNSQGAMVVPLKVKNVEGNAAAVSMYETIDGMPNGSWQTCAFGNCMTLSASGYSAKNIISGTDAYDIQTEWIPEQGNYAFWTATLQIHLFNTITKTVFGMEQQVAGEEIIGYGPKVTINFVYGDNVNLPKKCATPTISFANGKLMFECETEGVEYVPSISLASSQHSNQIELFSVYRFSVYAKKNGYLDSDVASVNIDLNRLKGDMNNDGAISIADAVAIVNVLLGGNSISLYYSVGTDAVTANNYTTANNAQNVSSLSAIPSTLLTVTTPGVYYILLPDQFEPEVGGVVYFNVTKLSINIPGYSVYRTTSLSAGVQIKRVNVGTSGSQIDYE